MNRQDNTPNHGYIVDITIESHTYAANSYFLNWNARKGIGGNDETDIAGSQTVTTGKDLIEKIGQVRKSVAAVQQQIIAPVVWIGSGTINVAQLMLDTLDVVKELAEQTASHTHSNTGTPTNAGAIRNTGTKADTLNGKYSPVIGK